MSNYQMGGYSSMHTLEKRLARMTPAQKALPNWQMRWNLGERFGGRGRLAKLTTLEEAMDGVREGEAMWGGGSHWAVSR